MSRLLLLGLLVCTTLAATYGLTTTNDEGCLPTGLRVHRSCFYFGHDPDHPTLNRPAFDYDTARSYCRKTYPGSDLATIEFKYESLAVIEGLPSDGDYYYWIGLRFFKGSDRLYKWTNNETVRYTNWRFGEPDMGQTSPVKGDCVALIHGPYELHTKGTWIAMSCSSRMYPMCQSPVKTAATTTSTASSTSASLDNSSTTTASPTEVDFVPTQQSSFTEAYTWNPDRTPFEMTCRRGVLNVSTTDTDLVESLTAVIRSDNTFNCRLVLKELHEWILSQSGQQLRSSVANQEQVRVECLRGKIQVSQEDPGTSEATSLLFRSGGSRKCGQVFHEFLSHVMSVYHAQRSSE